MFRQKRSLYFSNPRFRLLRSREHPAAFKTKDLVFAAGRILAIPHVFPGCSSVSRSALTGFFRTEFTAPDLAIAPKRSIVLRRRLASIRGGLRTALTAKPA
jgi:hypothetical protein